MDVAWALLRMPLTYLMQSGIFAESMQQVPCLGGYQSILNPAALRLRKIGHCHIASFKSEVSNLSFPDYSKFTNINEAWDN